MYTRIWARVASVYVLQIFSFSCATDDQFKREQCIKDGHSDLGLEILRSEDYERRYKTAEGTIPPKVIPSTQIVPRYPKRLRAVGIRGRVMLLITISEEGNVSHIEYLCGNGYLARNAIHAIMQWKYVPAQRDGKPVAVKLIFPFVFKID